MRPRAAVLFACTGACAFEAVSYSSPGQCTPIAPVWIDRRAWFSLTSFALGRVAGLPARSSLGREPWLPAAMPQPRGGTLCPWLPPGTARTGRLLAIETQVELERRRAGMRVRVAEVRAVDDELHRLREPTSRIAVDDVDRPCMA